MAKRPLRSYLGRFLAWLASHTASNKKSSLAPRTGIRAAMQHNPLALLVMSVITTIIGTALVFGLIYGVKGALTWTIGSPTFLKVLGAIVVVLIVFWIVRIARAKGYMTKLSWSPILGTLGVIAVIALVWYGYQKHESALLAREISRDKAEINRLKTELHLVQGGNKEDTITVLRGAREVVPISVGDSISFQRLDSVAYRLKLSNGRKFEVPLGLTGLLELPPSTRSISFELDSASTADSVRISIRKWRAKWM